MLKVTTERGEEEYVSFKIINDNTFLSTHEKAVHCLSAFVEYMAKNLTIKITEGITIWVIDKRNSH